MRFLLNIRVRLTLAYMLVVAILILFASGVAYILLSQSLSRRTIDPWSIQVADGLSGTSDGRWHQVVSLTDMSPQIGIGWSDQNTMVRAYTPSELLARADADGNIYLGDGIPVVINKDLILTNRMNEASVLWFYYQAPTDRFFVVTQSSYVLDQTLATFRSAVAITAVVTLVMAGILGYFLVSRMLEPVQEITRSAKEIEEKNLSRRLPVVTRDELGELASTLNQTFARLEAAFVREREFTADASHELRTPLAIAQGEATLALKEKRSRDQYQKALESISDQISRASTLINRLLFLARSDDRLELVVSRVNLESLLTEAAADARVLCEPKKIALQWEPPAGEEFSVSGDLGRLRELFLNLLENAVRYTPEGGSITIGLRQEGGYAKVSVRDTGIGIAPEHLPRIFERFYRVDKSRSRAEGGAGLGLAICKHIAEMHRGKIEVESRVGVGSTFTVFLPTSKQGKQTLPAGHGNPGEPKSQKSAGE